MPLIDLTDDEVTALVTTIDGETADQDTLDSVRTKLTPEAFPEQTFEDEYGQQDGETIPGGGYDVELVVEGSTEPDPVSEETI